MLVKRKPRKSKEKPGSVKAEASKPKPISAELKVEMWSIDRVKPYEKNARKLSPKAVEKVAASIREFGWRQPIVVDSKGVIIVGHTRLMGAQYLGLKEVPVHVADNLTPAQVKAYRLMDNRSHDESEWDFELVAPELLDLKLADFNIDLTGFEKLDVVGALFPNADGKEPKKNGRGKEAPDGLAFKIVVECDGEVHQSELMARFKEDGLKCKPLIA
jgi:hypothetical protein